MRRRLYIRPRDIEEALGLGDLGQTLTTAGPGWLHPGSGPRVGVLRRPGAPISATIAPMETVAPPPTPSPTPTVQPVVSVAPAIMVAVPDAPPPPPPMTYYVGAPKRAELPVHVEQARPLAPAVVRPGANGQVSIVELPQEERAEEKKGGFPWWILAVAAPFVI